MDRLLEHHADATAQVHHVHARLVDVHSTIRMRPSTRVPGMMSFIRFSVRRKVLLPHPDGPMKAVTTFGLMRIESLLQRRFSP